MTTTFGILEPTSLLGKEIGERLHSIDASHSIRAFTFDADRAGELAEFGRGAALLEHLQLPNAADEGANLEDLTALFVPAEIDRNRLQEIRELLPADCHLVLADGSGWSEGLAKEVDLRPRLASLSGPPQSGSSFVPYLLSPRPGLLAQAVVLSALSSLEPQRFTCTAVEPMSTLCKAAIEELLDQTRSILAFSGEMPTEVLQRQQAFNLFPSTAGDTTNDLQTLTGIALLIGSEQRLIGGVFHGLSVSLQCSFSEPVRASRVREVLDYDSLLSAVSEDQSAPNPVEVAGSAEVQFRVTTPHDEPVTTHFLWLVLDNLTSLGAWNAVSLVLADAIEEVH